MKRVRRHASSLAEVQTFLAANGWAPTKDRYGYGRANVARRALGLPPLKVAWRDEWNALLGTMPDPALAAHLGVGLSTVHARRQSLGIKARTSALAVRLRALPDVDFATMTAVDIAARERCSRMPVVRERQRRSITGPGPKNPDTRVYALRAAVAGMLAIGVSAADIGRVLHMSRQRAHQLAEEVRMALRAEGAGVPPCVRLPADLAPAPSDPSPA